MGRGRHVPPVDPAARAKAQKKQRGEVDAAWVRRWLSEKGVDEGCPLCGQEDLRVSKDFFTAIGVRAGTAQPDTTRGSLMIRVRCANCAHVMFFHARHMGLA